jgi:hypothetical protein
MVFRRWCRAVLQGRVLEENDVFFNTEPLAEHAAGLIGACTAQGLIARA